ncbi:hypothetical protein DACRYDRAFT_20752 [Dacryopinax primogenitus]|uniref:Ubiquitin carboxyl-terminal hydrolase n=1 Tax=Dacryopinax primogenitus (strain DJM 731) TaxID=1858805 RepID=M5G5W8_DACPD|nr:uncharacterized protein DACRYDRAFT_20752 [Dacryopinax primogenitus]EJU04119.1 hypothetical protein DACRYDRAFT_20752 [Dacryopinax primogenitus]
MSDESGWSLTESDPAVFTALLQSLGCNTLIVDDLWTLDDPALLSSLQPIHALIFLFKWIGGTEDEAADGELKGGGRYDEAFPGFFAHQVVNDACATIAVLNGVFNIPSVPMGPDLSQLREFSAGMDPLMSGYSITNSAAIRNAHNALSSSANSPFSIDPSLYDQNEKEDAFHFVVYVPVAGQLYELDGLRRAPVQHGGWEGGEGWLDVARRTIQRRIEGYPPGTLQFSLLAVRTDNLPGMEAQLEQARAAGDEHLASELVHHIYAEKSKRAEWEFENSLRRHNHVGLIHSLLLALAKAGGLDTAVQKAKQKMIEARQKAAKSDTKMEED